MSLKAIVFDRDGVLTEFDIEFATQFFAKLLPNSVSIYDLSKVWNEWGTMRGFPRNLAEEVNFFRDFWLYTSALYDLPIETEAALLEMDYKQFFLPFPDALPAVSFAKDQGLKIGILSNFPLASLAQSLTAIGIGHLVDVAYSATMIGYAKPDPRSYQTVLDALGVKAEETLFFDDEFDCVEGARHMGMQAYHVDRSLTEYDFSADIVCDLACLNLLLSREPIFE